MDFMHYRLLLRLLELSVVSDYQKVFFFTGFDGRPLDTLLDWYRRCEECLSSCNVALCNLATDVMICAHRNGNYYLASQFAKKTLLCYKLVF